MRPFNIDFLETYDDDSILTELKERLKNLPLSA